MRCLEALVPPRGFRSFEEELPQATKVDRVRERTRLLDACVLPEQVRRMCRRAGVSMHQTTATGGEDTLVQVVQRICDVYLHNLCKEINRLCAHLRKKTITEDIVREALKTFHLKLFGSCEDRHAVCRTMKSHRGETGNQDWRDYQHRFLPWGKRCFEGEEGSSEGNAIR